MTMKRAVDRKRHDIQFKVGDFVYLNTSNLSLPAKLSKKLAAKFIGPYPVTKCIS